MTNFQIEVAHHISEFDPRAWDQISGNRPLASHRWYCFGETVLTGDEPTYILLSHEGQVVARATFWLAHREPLPLPSGVVRSALQAMLRRWPLLVCRAPLSSTSGLIMPNEPTLRATALDTFSRAARDLMQSRHASILLFDYLERQEAEADGWPKLRTTTFPQMGTHLNIVWPDFETYVRQLPQSVRKDYRRHRNHATELGIKVIADQAPPPMRDTLALIRNVEKHHGTPPNPLAEAILRHGGLIDGVWLKAVIDDRLVGCGFVIGEGQVRFLAMLGLDYSVQYVYFQLVYTAIRHVIETGVQTLRGGGGAYGIKRRLGFQLDSNNYARYAVRGRLLNVLTHLADRSWTTTLPLEVERD